jgi:membrane protein
VRVLDFGRRAVARIIEVEVVDRGIALAALSFTALVPLAVVFASLAPGVDPDALSDAIVRRFRLDAQTADIVQSAFSPPHDVRGTVSVGGALLVVGSALSFTRALQRAYERAWRLPQLGVRATPAGVMWLLAVVVLAFGFGALRALVVDASRPVVSVIAGLAFSAALWLFTPWVLLSRRVAWRALLPTALLTAVAMTVLSGASMIYMPRSIEESAERYGPVGVSIALISWLVGAGFVLVGCAAVGEVLSGGDVPGDADAGRGSRRSR